MIEVLQKSQLLARKILEVLLDVLAVLLEFLDQRIECLIYGEIATDILLKRLLIKYRKSLKHGKVLHASLTVTTFEAITQKLLLSLNLGQINK